MAVVSTRLGRVLPGSRPTPARFAGIPGPGGEKDGGIPQLKDEEDTSTSGAGSILSGQASLARAKTERDKFLAEQAAAEAALQRQQQGALLQAAYLRNQLGAGIPSVITKEIENQQTAGEKYIADQAAALLGELQKRETQARGMTTTGFSNLMNYLARTQPTAFAQAQRSQPQTVQSALGQYMSGQGVSPAVAQEAANIANVQAAGGAANYNQLLDVLAAREQAAQQSRQSEAEMGLASQLANLQSIYGQGTASLEQQRLAALADLSSRISAARLQAQQDQAARDRAIQDALASLLGSGTLDTGSSDQAVQDIIKGLIPQYETPDGGVEPGVGGVQQTAVQALAAKLPGIRNESLATKVASFVAKNPNASAAQVKKAFPKLGANIG
jgi:hypothetical protein